MPAFNPGRKLPPAALLVPAAVLAMASVLLLIVVLGEGRAIRTSAIDGTLARTTPAVGDDAPLPEHDKPVDARADLARSELFGHFDPHGSATANAAKSAAQGTAKLGDKAPAALPEATLALKLQGIVYKQDPAQRRAIIAGDGPSPEAHKIGETLLGDAVIRYIEARRVVVEQHGELKALSLIEPVLGPPGGAQAAMPGNAPGGEVPSFMVPPPQGGALDPAMEDPQTYEDPQSYAEPPSDALDEPPPDDSSEPMDEVDSGAVPEPEPEPTQRNATE